MTSPMYLLRNIHRSLLVAVVCVTSCLADGNQAFAAFTVQFDPTQSSAVSNGTTQTFSIDLLMQYINDGSPGTLSSFTFDIADPGVGLTFANPGVADVVWELGPSLSTIGAVSSVGAFNVTSPTDVVLTDGQTIRLMTLDFVLDGSITNASFPLLLSFQDANRDPFAPIDASEFQFPAGVFTVTAVPEPTGLCAIALLTSAIVRRGKNYLRGCEAS
jgi:hypothetical protein